MDRGNFRIRKCAVMGVEAIEARSGHVFSRHTHDAFAVGRIVDGAQRWWSGRGSVEARQGDMISSNAGEVHDGAPIGDTRTWKMIYTAPSLVAEVVRDIEEGRTDQFEFKNPVLGRIAGSETFEYCYAALTRAPFDSLAAQSALVQLFAALCTPMRTGSPAAPRPALLRVKERMDDDPLAVLSLQELAEEAGLSRYQTLRGFARLTGLPPHAYQIQRRLDLARRLIAEGATPSDAAAAAGFSDQSHLHRTFVRRFGITPGAYARALN